MVVLRYFFSLCIFALIFSSNAFGQTIAPFQVSYRCASGHNGNLSFQGCLAAVGAKEQRCFFGTSFSNKAINLDLGVSFLLQKTSKPVAQSEVCLRSSGISAYDSLGKDLTINASTASRSASSQTVTTLANCPIYVKVGKPFGVTLDLYQSVNSSSAISSGVDCELTIVNSANYRK